MTEAEAVDERAHEHSSDEGDHEQELEGEQQQAPASNDVAAPSPGGAGGGKQQDGTGLLLPLARVKKMMKDTGDVKMVSAEASYAVARAAELFLQELAARSHSALQQDSGQRKALDYKDVAAVVHTWDAVDFLRSVVPQKVKFGDVVEQLKKQHEEMQPRCLADD